MNRTPVLMALLIGTVLAQTSPGVAPASRTACPASHPVKGNINRQGEHIFHLPGGAYYTRTDPERCFKNAIEAAQAGFRVSKRQPTAPSVAPPARGAAQDSA